MRTRALVTGGSSGIGAALVAALVRRGANVACTGRSRAALDDIAAQTGAWTLAADLTKDGQPAAVVEAAVDHLGGLDLLVSCAGSGWMGPYARMPTADIDLMVDLNLRAPLHLVRAALPHLLDAGRAGRTAGVVLVGSIAGTVGVPDEAAYSAAKAGLAGLAEALRAELADQFVGVTLVTPGVVSTSFFTRRNRPYVRAWPRPIDAAQVADAILDGVARKRPEVLVPRWLALPARLHGGLPALYRSLARRFA